MSVLTSEIATPTPTAEGPNTLIQALQEHARSRPDHPAVTFLDYGQSPSGQSTTITYRDLDQRARNVAEQLTPGDRVAVLCPQGLDYVAAFLGCLYAGAIAVPLYAPEPFRSTAGLTATLGNARPRLLLTTGRSLAAVAEVSDVPALCVDGLAPDTGRRPTAPDRDSVAYLQYTSGSTSAPRGVVLSHGNLAWSAHQCAQAFGVDGDSRVAVWLPLFHDMGLVAGVALPLAAGAHSVLMDPMAFVQHPLRWLRALSEHRATYTAIPNFALDMCVDRTTEADRAGLDLSHLTAVTNGSEPVRARSLCRFAAAFEIAGFDPAAHAPSFGLAEATVLVTAKPYRTRPAVITCDRAELDQGRVRLADPAVTSTRQLVGCGAPVSQDVRVVDRDGRGDLGVDRVGEVWVRGPNVGSGYFERADPLTFTERGWLRTGDAGFLHDGQLYLAGRYKDLIVLDGRNHHPSDLEATVEAAIPGIRRGHLIAFSADVDDIERLVIVAEQARGTGQDPAQTLRLARRAVTMAHGVELHDFRLTARGRLPKTTSGKLQRNACRDRYLAGGYDA
ncbi:MAG: fatty acyl-AMP ligase [Streptosporangiaceae bacterium]